MPFLEEYVEPPCNTSCKLHHNTTFHPAFISILFDASMACLSTASHTNHQHIFLLRMFTSSKLVFLVTLSPVCASITTYHTCQHNHSITYQSHTVLCMLGPGLTHPPSGAPVLSRSSMSGSIQTDPASQSQPQVPTAWHFPCYGYSGAVQCDGDSWSAHNTYENSLPVSSSAPVDIPGSGAHEGSDRSSAGSGATRARGVSMGERPRPVMPPGSPSRILFRISQNMQNANLTDATMEMAIQALP